MSFKKDSNWKWVNYKSEHLKRTVLQVLNVNILEVQ